MVELLRSVKVIIDTNKQTEVFDYEDYNSLDEMFADVKEWLDDM